MDYTEKQLHSELIFDGHVLHLYKDDILLPDGKVGFREYCKHVGQHRKAGWLGNLCREH